MGYYNATLIRMCEKARKARADEWHHLADLVDESQDNCYHPKVYRKTSCPNDKETHWCGLCSRSLTPDGIPVPRKPRRAGIPVTTQEFWKASYSRLGARPR